MYTYICIQAYVLKCVLLPFPLYEQDEHLVKLIHTNHSPICGLPKTALLAIKL